MRAAMPGQRSRSGRRSSRPRARATIRLRSASDRAAGHALPEVRLERRPLIGRELVVEVLGEPVGPLVAHVVLLTARDAAAAPCAPGAAGTSRCRSRGRASRRSPRADSLPRRAGRTPAAPLRQPLDRRLEVHGDLRRRPRGPAPSPARRPHPVALAPDAQGLAPAEDDVDRQPVEPGAERRLSPKRPQLLPGADEDVLDHVVRVLVAQHAADEARDPRQVAAVEPLEGVRVPAGGQRRVYRVRVGPAGAWCSSVAAPVPGGVIAGGWIDWRLKRLQEVRGDGRTEGREDGRGRGRSTEGTERTRPLSPEPALAGCRTRSLCFARYLPVLPPSVFRPSVLPSVHRRFPP